MDTEWEDEFQQYCNYPEVSKPRPSLNVAGAQPIDLENHIYVTSNSFGEHEFLRETSPSLMNYLKSSLSHGDSTQIEEMSEPDISEITTYEEPQEFKRKEKYPEIHPLIDTVGWIKYASDPDPWNEDNYSLNDDSLLCIDGVLTSQMVSECSRKLAQLPDDKAFVFSRLHINKKDLKDISVLSDYRYFQYIDMSWNFLVNIEALSNCSYLMYLNVSHNKLTVLDIKPLWFLTHVNLNCNEIKEIGQNLANFWSLRYVDLSYNHIEKIEGLHNLKYLRYLNLSHNHIKRIENLECINLEELYIQFNEISECDRETAGLHVLKNIKKLNVAHNKISRLLPFQGLFSIKELDISYNGITELYELEFFVGCNKLYDLNLVGNPVCANTGYREFLIFKLSCLKSLDCVPVHSSERVAAKMLLEPDIFTSSQHLRTKIELWNQLAPQTINAETIPSGQPLLPLILLIGTFANCKEDVAKALVLKFPDQIYRFKKHTTMPSANSYDTDNLISVSIDEFNLMIKNGQFLFHYKEIGFFFGVCRDEMCKCVVDDKIGLIDTVLEAAMVTRSLGLYPITVLCVLSDEQGYVDKLTSLHQDLDLWSSYCKTSFDKQDSSGIIKNGSFGNEETDCNYHINVDNSNSNSQSDVLIGSKKMFGSTEHGKFSLDDSVMWNSSTNSSQTFKRSLDCKQATAGVTECEEDNFVWSWSLESSVASVQSEPDKDHLNMLRGREKFVQKTLSQQNLYIEMHNLKPGLFTDTVFTDDVDNAVKKISKTCRDILDSRKDRKFIGNVIKDSLCKKFVEDRVKWLLTDLLNVPS